MANQSDSEKRIKDVDSIRKEMEELARNIRDLVLSQPPVQLLGYLLAQFQLAMMLCPDGSEEEPRPNKDAVKTFQFALEYVHAIWSCHSPLVQEQESFDENAAGALMITLAELERNTDIYCSASSETETEFWAKSAWAMIRGHRYQALEEEFFQFVLEPHDAALRKAHGVGFKEIAAGIQSISNAFRMGPANAIEKLAKHMDDTYQKAETSGVGIEAIIDQMKTEDSSFTNEASGAIKDLLFGGVCNLSRHSGLPQSVLEDISYEPGENTDFFAEGDFSGTPMRTLPARIRPGIKLGDDFYATDGQFVRDSAYRAIQWGLWKRLDYRDEWLKRQGQVVEQAFTKVLQTQLRGAQIFESVYFRDVRTGNWVETDRLVLLEDTLFVIEAKAGVMPMQSPATNFASHERVIKELIVKAYRQCERFLDYLASGNEKNLYKLVNRKHVKIASIRQDQFRLIFPIGLTVEAFTPFSAMAKELSGVKPILGSYPFMSMSADDLFVMRRLLLTTGELVHYFEVRQQVAGMKGGLLFDEIDHLGAYIAKNRFDLDITEQLKDVDQVTWDGFCDEVDRFFEGENWLATLPPTQPFPLTLIKLFKALDELRPHSWLSFDSRLRNYGQDGRQNISKYLDDLEPTLAKYPQRRFMIINDEPIQIWLCRQNAIPTNQEIQYQTQVGCLAAPASKMPVIVIAYSEFGLISSLICKTYCAPVIIQSNYQAICDDAERQRDRMVKLS